MKSAEIFNEIRKIGDFNGANNKAITELKEIINFYNESSPSILVKVTFLQELNLKTGKKKIPANLTGILKNLTLKRINKKLKIKLLLSIEKKKFDKEIEREINLQDMIQILPIQTAPCDNPFSKKAKKIWEQDIENQIKKEREEEYNDN